MNMGLSPSFMLGLFVFLCLFGMVAFVCTICFLVTLMTTLNKCGRRNRTLEPAMVWLNLIPLWNFVWSFLMTGKIADSLKREFADREIDDGGDYGKTLGMSWAAMQVLAQVIAWIGAGIQFVEDIQRAGPPRNPFDISFNVVSLASIPFSFLTLGLMVVYWVKIHGYSKRLDEDDKLPPVHRDDDRYRDDDDDLGDRPRRPASRPDDRIQ
jgi:hypothetical protein